MSLSRSDIISGFFLETRSTRSLVPDAALGALLKILFQILSAFTYGLRVNARHSRYLADATMSKNFR